MEYKLAGLVDCNLITMQKKENGPLSNWAVRGMFLELWNTTKSLSAIWQIFSCLLTCQGDCKNYRTKNMHENEIPLWLFEQEKAANPVNLAAIFCLGFGHGNQISCIFFWSLLVKYFYYNLRTHPIISTVWKNFSYFSNIRTVRSQNSKSM